MLALSPLLCASLFLSMRQDLQVRLLQKRLTELDTIEAQLTREMGEQRRQLAERTDLSLIMPRIAQRGLVPARGQQVLALTASPTEPAATRSLPTAVLDFLSGADPVLAARRAPASNTPRTGPEDEGR